MSCCSQPSLSRFTSFPHMMGINRDVSPEHDFHVDEHGPTRVVVVVVVVDNSL